MMTPAIQTTIPPGSFPADARLWIISDGKAGTEAQCLGVAEALGIAPEIKHVAPRGLYALAAPYGPADPRDGFEPGGQFRAPWPHLAIACGRLTTPCVRAINRKSGLATYTVVLLDPKTGPRTADLFWVPEHDKRRGANVVTTLTSPHRFSPARLAGLRASVPPSIAALSAPRVAVLVGGPNGDYAFTGGDVSRLLGILAELARRGAALMITCSRRTPPDLVAGIDAGTQGAARIFWTPEAGDAMTTGVANPYPEFLAHADAFIVTADSVNMVGEACVTGRPVHVFHPSGGSRKFDRFHSSLADYGATRPLTTAAQLFETWSYVPLYSATAIAAEITRRYARRAAMLGNLMDTARRTDGR